MYRKENLEQCRELLHFFLFLSIQQDSKNSSNFTNICVTGLKFIYLGKFLHQFLSHNDFQQLYVHKVCIFILICNVHSTLTRVLNYSTRTIFIKTTQWGQICLEVAFQYDFRLFFLPRLCLY